MPSVPWATPTRAITGARPLPRSFLARSSRVVAPELLNKVIVAGDRALRIVEVEAYLGADDPASHAYRGRTRRNATMFGPAGHLYVYRSYGLHFCANVVCGPEGLAMAVLLRAGAPVVGLGPMRAARPGARSDLELAAGPGRLCQALGIDLSCDGVDLLVSESEVRLVCAGWAPPRRPARGPRVGVSAAADRRLRWWVAGDPHVSRRR